MEFMLQNSSMFAGDELPPQIALQFEILGAHQQCISDFLNFCIVFGCKGKGEERALSEVGRAADARGQVDSFIWHHHRSS